MSTATEIERIRALMPDSCVAIHFRWPKRGWMVFKRKTGCISGSTYWPTELEAWRAAEQSLIGSVPSRKQAVWESARWFRRYMGMAE